MPDQTEPTQNKEYAVYLSGGKILTITAHRIFINRAEDRVYFITADNETVEDWLVVYSNVAAIHTASGNIIFGGINS